MSKITVALVCALLFSFAPSLPVSGADTLQETVTHQRSEILQQLAPRYAQVARENLRTFGNRTAIVPSPSYANGIYARDSFYSAIGLDDQGLSYDLYAWFASGQNTETGQIPTAVAFDPADQSLQPQDDESTLLFVLWSFILARDGYDVDKIRVSMAWDFVQSHVKSGRYYSSPGNFRYWADCWHLKHTDVLSYVQGLYVLAAQAAQYFGLASAASAVDAAQNGYRALHNDVLGFMPLSAYKPGNSVQDVSSLFPEFLHRLVLNKGILPDEKVLSTVDHHLATLGAYSTDSVLVGIKVLADRSGRFLPESMFSDVCAGMRNPGDYHNGGYWPMYTIVEISLAYSIAPTAKYRSALEQLVRAESESGMGVEYWQLLPGSEGYVPPGRQHYSWNVLGLRAMRYAGLVN